MQKFLQFIEDRFVVFMDQGIIRECTSEIIPATQVGKLNLVFEKGRLEEVRAAINQVSKKARELYEFREGHGFTADTRGFVTFANVVEKEPTLTAF